MCLESSWQTAGDTRLTCVEGCGCPVPTTHAHCYLTMTATCDVAGDGRRMTRCPACTLEVAEPMPSVLRKAQHNHEAMRRVDPGYSTERTAMMHAVLRGATNMIAAAREYHRRTRQIAREVAETQCRLAGCAQAIVDGVEARQPAETVRAAAVNARDIAMRGLAESVGRVDWPDGGPTSRPPER